MAHVIRGLLDALMSQACGGCISTAVSCPLDGPCRPSTRRPSQAPCVAFSTGVGMRDGSLLYGDPAESSWVSVPMKETPSPPQLCTPDSASLHFPAAAQLFTLVVFCKLEW